MSDQLTFFGVKKAKAPVTIDLLKHCFERAQLKEAHIDEIAAHVLRLSLIDGYTKDDLALKVGATLASHVNKKRGKDLKFARVPNGKGGYKRGIYRLKGVAAAKLSIVPITENDTGFKGKAGEHAVMSELLFRGYNASLMSVDKGIDVVASKSEKYFHIQVKTSNAAPDRSHSSQVKLDAFQNAAGTFYVLVMRKIERQRYINDYLVMPASEIYNLMRTEKIKPGKTISLRVSVDEKGRHWLYGDDVQQRINDFSVIC